MEDNGISRHAVIPGQRKPIIFPSDGIVIKAFLSPVRDGLFRAREEFDFIVQRNDNPEGCLPVMTTVEIEHATQSFREFLERVAKDGWS
jgi:hypothetical protein